MFRCRVRLGLSLGDATNSFGFFILVRTEHELLHFVLRIRQKVPRNHSARMSQIPRSCTERQIMWNKPKSMWRCWYTIWMLILPLVCISQYGENRGECCHATEIIPLVRIATHVSQPGKWEKLWRRQERIFPDTRPKRLMWYKNWTLQQIYVARSRLVFVCSPHRDACVRVDFVTAKGTFSGSITFTKSDASPFRFLSLVAFHHERIYYVNFWGKNSNRCWRDRHVSHKHRRHNTDAHYDFIRSDFQSHKILFRRHLLQIESASNDGVAEPGLKRNGVFSRHSCFVRCSHLHPAHKTTSAMSASDAIRFRKTLQSSAICSRTFAHKQNLP